MLMARLSDNPFSLLAQLSVYQHVTQTQTLRWPAALSLLRDLQLTSLRASPWDVWPGRSGVLKNPESRHCEVAAGDRGNLLRQACQRIEIATTTPDTPPIAERQMGYCGQQCRRERGILILYVAQRIELL